MKKSQKTELRRPVLSMPEANDVLDALGEAISIDDFYGKDGTFQSETKYRAASS